jgi:hypothetical protein
MATITNPVGIYVSSGQIRETLKVFPFGGSWLLAWWDVKSQNLKLPLMINITLKYT